MSAILTALFKFTFGLAAARARNVLADRLKEGDVVDQKFRDLIVSDIKDIKSRLEALSRNDLMAAVEYFDTGLCYLFDAVSYVRNNDNAIRRAAQVSERNNEKHFDELTLTSATSPENTIGLTVGIQNLQLNESVDEEAAKTALSDAKDRFSDARKKATNASTNVALSTFDRITAIRYRAMAAMLEYAADTVGTSGDWKSALKRALPECKKCLEKLNSLPAVKNCFKVELEKRIGKGLIGNDERKKIISIVCQVNSVIYDAIQAVGGDLHVWVWPYVDTGNDRVDPLRDGRISKVLRKDNMEHCCLTPSPWSFGQESYVGDTTVKGIYRCSDMSSIVTSVFNATIGWLVNKERDVTAERLKEGEIADQKIRDLIVREVEDINSKLEGFSRQDLLEAVDLFKTGIKYLFEAFDVKPSDQASVGITGENLSENDLEEAMTTVSAGKLEKMDFNETMKNFFFQAQKRFKRAHRKATISSYNEALKIFDRITAIRYRVMATVLESLVKTVGTTGDMSPSSLKITLKNALPECEECLLKLHCLPAVQKCFKVVLEKGRLGHFRKDREETRKIVSIVCQVNRVIYNMTQAAGKTWVRPFLNTGKEEVVPLRDERIREVLRKVNMEHCCVSKRPWGIATNSKVQFLIADNGDKTVKVFGSNGKFDFRFNPQTDDADTEIDILNVATADMDDQIYLLVELEKPGAGKWESEVQVFNKTGDLQYKFPVRRRYWDRLTVSSGKQRGKILLLGGNVVDVHEPSGKFVCSFGEGVFKSATDITATCDGHVMILDRDGVFLFHVERQQLDKFIIKCWRDDYNRIACHPATEHFVLAGNERETDRLTLAIYTLNGEFVRRIQLDEELFHGVDGITVTVEGHIAVAFPDKQYSGKVIVV